MCETATDLQIEYIVDAGAIEALKSMLDAQDAQMVMEVLSGLDEIFSSGEGGSESTYAENGYAVRFDSLGGVSMLQQLGQHPNIEVFKKVNKILDRYFFFEDMEYNRATNEL